MLKISTVPSSRKVTQSLKTTQTNAKKNMDTYSFGKANIHQTAACYLGQCSKSPPVPLVPPSGAAADGTRTAEHRPENVTGRKENEKRSSMSKSLLTAQFFRRPSVGAKFHRKKLPVDTNHNTKSNGWMDGMPRMRKRDTYLPTAH